MPSAIFKFRSKTVTHFVFAVAVVIVCLLPQQVDSRSSAALQIQQFQQEKSQQVPENALNAHNFLIGIARIGVQNEPHSQCGRELEQLFEAIDRKQLWALKVIDTFGAAPRSFLWGNYFWFSAQELCEELNEPFRITFSPKHKISYDFNVTSPFLMEFMLIYAEFQSPFYIDLKLPFKYFLHLGLCLPSSCQSAAIFNYTNLYFRNGSNFATQRDYQLQLQPVEMRRPHFSWRYFKQPGFLIYIFLFVLVISLVISAEIVFKSKQCLLAQQQMHSKQNSQPVSLEKFTKNSGSAATHERLLLCFRLPENYRRAIALDKKDQNTQNFLSAIAGLRTIICLWVTVFHVYYYSLYAMSNAPLIFAKLEHFALQPIMQACFYVDVFFVMSAFLLVYNFVQNENQMKRIKCNNFKKNLKLYGKAVLHRYLRLTPVMLVTMLLSDMVFDFLNMYSPFRLGEHSGIYCKRNWWYNLLYIHNFLDMQEICCSWTWYLACEMQYFVLFTALLYMYAKRPKLTQLTFGILAAIFVVISWLCNQLNGISFQIDVIHNTLNELYVKPWVRINPYIGGAIAGWLLHRLQRQKQQQQQQNGNININGNSNISCTSANTNTTTNSNNSHSHSNINNGHATNANTTIITATPTTVDASIHRFWLALFWFSCFALYAVTNFMSYWRSTPAWLVAVIMSFGKLIFALYIGGVIVLCALGHGGYVQRLLSIRLLQFLNRFCFSIYMLAPVIVIGAFGLRREATNFTEVGSGMDFLALLTLSIASAFLLVLLVELPMQRLSNIFVKGSSSNKRSSSCCSATTSTTKTTTNTNGNGVCSNNVSLRVNK